MNVHALLDRWTVQLSRFFFGRSRYFRDGIECPSLAEHLNAISLPRTAIDGAGLSEWTVGSLAGQLQGAVRVAQWRSDKHPTVIFHHGTSEMPFDRSFRRILPYTRHDIPANLVVVRAPFHRSLRDFLQGIRTLTTYAAMLAVSVRVIEALVSHFRTRGIPQTVVSGISLGGFITNLHHTYFNTATFYRPLLAGTAMDAVFTETCYRRLVAPAALTEAVAIRDVLNFEAAFARTDRSNVFPLLARYDQFIEYERQKAAYGEQPIAVLGRGHVTGALAYTAMGRHVLTGLSTEMPRSP